MTLGVGVTAGRAGNMSTTQVNDINDTWGVIPQSKRAEEENGMLL